MYYYWLGERWLMVFSEMWNIFRNSYNYQDNGELPKQIEQKLSRNSHLAIECCEEMGQLTNTILIENQQGNQEATQRSEIFSLRLCRYSEERMNTDKNVND